MMMITEVAVVFNFISYHQDETCNLNVGREEKNTKTADTTPKSPCSRPSDDGDLLYNLSAKILVYTHGIEIFQQVKF